MDMIEQSLNKFINAVKELQDQHLSFIMLSSHQLQDLFTRQQKIPSQKNTELIVSKLFDLFQDLFGGDDVVVLLHVPMIPQNTILHLPSIYSIPTPIRTNTLFSQPSPPDLLALSNSKSSKWTIVSQYSLITGHKVSSIYVCSVSSILSKNTVLELSARMTFKQPNISSTLASFQNKRKFFPLMTST